MDEIEYKLKTKNPVLISHAISTLLQIINKKYEITENLDVLQMQEYKLLVSNCQSDVPALCVSANQALVILAQNGLVPTSTLMFSFISCLRSSRNSNEITEVSIIGAISQLLIMESFSISKENKYTFHAHPLIQILKYGKHCWKHIFNEIHFIFKHPNKTVKENRCEILRPVLLYVLCDPFHPSIVDDCCKQQLWNLIINTNDTQELQLEILQWLQVKENSCIDTNYKILVLARKILKMPMKDKEFCTILAVLLSALNIQLLEVGYSPQTNIQTLQKLLDYCDKNAGSIILGLMSEVILICPAPYLHHITSVCSIIIDKLSCSNVILNALAASLLKWVAYPSLLCSETTDMIKDLINDVKVGDLQGSTRPTFLNRTCLALFCTNPQIQFYMEFNRLMCTWKQDEVLIWLNNIQSTSIDIRDRCRSILCGIFLSSTDIEITVKICKILTEIAKERPYDFASHMLSLILYKLTNSVDSRLLHQLLLALPELAIVKENTQIIIHTFELMLNSNKHPLMYLTIELLMRAMEKNQYQFFEQIYNMITECIKSDNSWQTNTICAKAALHICNTYPAHSKELVPIINHILNVCVDTNGAAASALAVKSITALCKSTVIEINSTWRIIAPKMKNETRRIVLESFCEFCGEIPSILTYSNDKYILLINDVMEKLWTYVTTSNDSQVIESALKALKNYRKQFFLLSTMPFEYKSDLNVSLISKENTSVPGTCWITMLKKIGRPLVSCAGDILIDFIKEELEQFHSSMYKCPRGEPYDYKYLSENSVIRAVGESLRLSEKFGPETDKVVTECLRIFAYTFTKPLPNIKWDFLNKLSQLSVATKKYSLFIMSRHASTSISAKNLTKNYLATYRDQQNLPQLMQNKDFLEVLQNLQYLCYSSECIDDLKVFLEAILNHTVENMNLGNEDAIQIFKRIMISFTTTLKDTQILSEARLMLANNLETLFDRMTISFEDMEPYIIAFQEISSMQKEKIITPSLWWEILPLKLRNAIFISTFTLSLPQINEIIDACITLPEMQILLLESIPRMRSNVNSELTRIRWTLDFMFRIQEKIKEASPEGKQLEFYCDLLFVSIISLSNLDCLLIEKESIITSVDTRTRLLPLAFITLSEKQVWKENMSQVIKWLRIMNTTFVSDVYKTAFHRSLRTLRHEAAYKNEWLDVLSIKYNESC
ncbi:focadhesin [Prorops nasuta]|uniref:focadhesin n=1 Tax=Prorops nasuta TaxID=863751 RepID=UPI0034CF08C2